MLTKFISKINLKHEENILFKIVIVLGLSIVSTVFAYAQTFEYKSHTNASSIASYSMPYRLFIQCGSAGEKGTYNNALLLAKNTEPIKFWGLVE